MKQIQGDEERNTASLKAQLDRLTTEYATQRELDQGKASDTKLGLRWILT